MTRLTSEALALAGTRDANERLEQAVRDNFQFIWRSLRRLGLRPDHAVDDAAQRVFEIAARKFAVIEPGRERAFFFKTALKVAHDIRRSGRVESARFAGEAVDGLRDLGASPEQALSQARLRKALDDVLNEMPWELATVFILFEIEDVPAVEIARLLELPGGTVASRLRRAREEFRTRVKRLGEAPLLRGER